MLDIKITLLTVLYVQLFIHLANYFRSTEPFCFSIGVLHTKCLDNLVFASLVWNIDYQGIVNHKVVMDCPDWRKFLGIFSTSLEFRICYWISNCQVCIRSITEDGSVNAVPQILYGQYLILGAFGSYMF